MCYGSSSLKVTFLCVNSLKVIFLCISTKLRLLLNATLRVRKFQHPTGPVEGAFCPEIRSDWSLRTPGALWLVIRLEDVLLTLNSRRSRPHSEHSCICRFFKLYTFIQSLFAWWRLLFVRNVATLACIFIFFLCLNAPEINRNPSVKARLVLHFVSSLAT